MRFFPVRDRILVKQLDENTTTASGIIKVGQVNDLVRGLVVGVGEGNPLHDRRIPIGIGDYVHFPPNVGVEVTLNGERFKVMQYDQVFGYESHEVPVRGQGYLLTYEDIPF